MSDLTPYLDTRTHSAMELCCCKAGRQALSSPSPSTSTRTARYFNVGKMIRSPKCKLQDLALGTQYISFSLEPGGSRDCEMGFYARPDVCNIRWARSSGVSQYSIARLDVSSRVLITGLRPGNWKEEGDPGVCPNSIKALGLSMLGWCCCGGIRGSSC